MPLAKDSRDQIVQSLRSGASETISLSGTVATSSAATKSVCRIVSSIDCYYSQIGTATTSSTILPAKTVETVRAEPGDVFSVITDGSSGTFNVTQLD